MATIPHFCAVVAEQRVYILFLEREGACQWQAPIAERRTRPPRRDAERHEAKIPHFCAVVAEQRVYILFFRASPRDAPLLLWQYPAHQTPSLMCGV